jgi:hypothetical protein
MMIVPGETGQPGGHKIAGGAMLVVYTSIGNSDDKLTQRQWCEFWSAWRHRVFDYAGQVHGDWASLPTAPYQNACLCIEIPEAAAETLRAELSKLAARFRQDSIAWAEAVTEFLSPAGS